MARITIEFERCKGCGLCVDTCKEECIEIGTEANSAGWLVAVFKDPEGKCKGCMQCAEMCPDVAIEVYR